MCPLIPTGPVVEALNPFAAVSVTFMKKPFVDFSLQFKESNGEIKHLLLILLLPITILPAIQGV